MDEGAKSWLGKSKEDLKTAKVLFENGRLEDCALYCQQSIEKSLKALYLKTNGEIPKMHDVFTLAKKLGLPKKLIGYSLKVTPVYFSSRYPDAPSYGELYTKKDCEEFLSYAKEVMEWIERKL
jgi:HEPN domain-containing protein